MAAKKQYKKPAQSKVKPRTQSQLYQKIGNQVDLTKKTVGEVMGALRNAIKYDLNKAGQFVMPGVLKIKTHHKPAVKAKKGVPNPFKPGQLMNVKAKPPSVKPKVLPLKGLKDMISQPKKKK